MSTLAQDSVDWVVEHLARHSDTDVVPKLFEFRAIAQCKEDLIKFILSKDICQWTTRAYRKCLTPKQRFGFRVVTQLDPLDSLMYLTLVYEIGDEIEKARLLVEQNVVFSSRFKPSDAYSMFDTENAYTAFQSRSRELAKNHGYVVVTDIADFYPRIYLHRLENSLQAKVANLPAHSTALMKLLKSWNQNVSYGIPVGGNASRLLAELVIDDVDRALLAEGMTFVRYVDDYRIFCQGSQQAYQCLARLANLLYDMHGLTLQAQKTMIIPTEKFLSEVLDTEEKKQLQNIDDNFSAILDTLGIDDPYQLLEYKDLPLEVRSQVDSLNLLELLRIELEKEEPDIPLLKMIINRLGWLKNADPVWEILGKIDTIFPVFTEIVRYLARLVGTIEKEERLKIGDFLLGKLEKSVVSQLEYHRMLIMGLFAGSNAWGNAEKLPRYYLAASDDWLRRSVILALGKAGQDYWLRAKKGYIDQMSAWEKRAFLYAASCFPEDEKKHWYNAILPRLDQLEKLVVKWSRSNPILT